MTDATGSPLIFDAHLDLAMNAVEWNRDLTRPLAEIREREAHLADRQGRGRGTVCLPEMRRGRVGLCVATQIARLQHDAYSPVFGWDSPAQAWAMTQAQRAWYEAMTEAAEMVPIRDRAGLDALLARWQNADSLAHSARDTTLGSKADTARDDAADTAREDAADSADDGAPDESLPIGYLLSLEGADSLIDIGYLERACTYGLRAIGPAHYGPGAYAMGTSTEGPFPPQGLELLREADRLGLILDVTHLSDASFWQALDLYRGPVWASHHNARALVPDQRQLGDDMFRALVDRGAVVGVALDAWMLVPGWQRGVTTPQETGLRLDRLVEHIDHFCQLAGNARHVGIGSDLDGAFGTEQTPLDLQSIADLQRIGPLLRERGFSEGDVAAILCGNFVEFLRCALP